LLGFGLKIEQNSEAFLQTNPEEVAAVSFWRVVKFMSALTCWNWWNNDMLGSENGVD
jgi:hypothetical protein